MKRFSVDSDAMKDWQRAPVRRTLGTVGPRQIDVRLASLEGVDYAALEARILAEILAQYPGAVVRGHIHDEWLIDIPNQKGCPEDVQR